MVVEKIKYWWSEDGKWFCILVCDGMSEGTISLTPAEAMDLARAVTGIYGQDAERKRSGSAPMGLVEAVMFGTR
jgi:hypothetical protein